ncbi:MAG TPA: OmpA family protein [Candidatus Binatia bacterium]|nr:OmpA family protein [Candidatus Binatia bacterium]
MIRRTILVVATVALSVMAGIHSSRAQSTATIVMRPGLVVIGNIYGGINTAGQNIGDYQSINRFIDISGGGFRYSFRLTSPTPIAGTESVSVNDVKNAANCIMYTGNGDATRAGWTSWLRISDQTFESLRTGAVTPFEWNGPDTPRSLRKIGEDDLPVLINEHRVKLHTLRVQTPDGGTLWINDDPGFPMVLKIAVKWKFVVTSINDPSTTNRSLIEGLQRGGSTTTHAILFAFDSAQLTDESKSVLDAVADYLRSAPGVRLQVQGHTDNIGGAQFNLDLSQKRAAAVKAYLIAKGIAASRLTAKGYGYGVPVADNATPEGRSLNRRVVFVTSAQ